MLHSAWKMKSDGTCSFWGDVPPLGVSYVRLKTSTSIMTAMTAGRRVDWRDAFAGEGAVRTTVTVSCCTLLRLSLPAA